MSDADDIADTGQDEADAATIVMPPDPGPSFAERLRRRVQAETLADLAERAGGDGNAAERAGSVLAEIVTGQRVGALLGQAIGAGIVEDVVALRASRAAYRRLVAKDRRRLKGERADDAEARRLRELRQVDLEDAVALPVEVAILSKAAAGLSALGDVEDDLFGTGEATESAGTPTMRLRDQLAGASFRPAMAALPAPPAATTAESATPPPAEGTTPPAAQATTPEGAAIDGAATGGPVDGPPIEADATGEPAPPEPEPPRIWNSIRPGGYTP